MGILSGIASSVLPILGNIAGNAILPGLGGAIGGAIGTGVAGSISNDASMADQKEYAKYQADLEQANWEKRFEMQNEYNDPSAFRQRLENAGYNPQLAVGSFSGNMAANPSTGMPTGQLSKYQTAMEMAIANKQLENDTKVAETQAEKNTAEAEKARAQAKREGKQSDYQQFINDMINEARNNSQGYNPFVQEETNYNFERQLKIMRYNLDKMLGERQADLELDKFSHQQMMDLTYIGLAQSKLELERAVSASQVQSNMAAAFMMSSQGMLAKATENGVWLDNGMKVVDLNYKQFNTLLDILGKIGRNELTFNEATKVAHETLKIDFEMADMLLKRAQSITRQIFTFGTFY